ncbi:hypothetical protein [Actinoallomurus iriomotensis]|uniref:hypothetical protein n=1 Tax=Actinoallomurus iriomotensis TaxID=478107 RepID=UPI002552EF2D|nr:hypothetical protein [Actinoallomurus iriomotensis]
MRDRPLGAPAVAFAGAPKYAFASVAPWVTVVQFVPSAANCRRADPAMAGVFVSPATLCVIRV